MAANSIYGELSLWDHPEFLEGSAFLSGLLKQHDDHDDQNSDGGPVPEDEPSRKDVEGDSADQVLLTSSSLQHGLFDEECSLTNWLESRIDVAEIDEMVNSPEFDAILSETVDDSSVEMLSTIDLHPLAFTNVVPQVAISDFPTQDNLPDESMYIDNDSDSIPQDSPSAFYPFGSPQDNDSDSNSDSNSSSSSNSCSSSPSLVSNSSCPKSIRKALQKEQQTSSDSFPLKDRRIKKRSQNKNAASRYRSKKKVEFGLLSETEADLLEKNKDLVKNASQLETEIGYLKGLMKEILFAKGLLKKSD